MGTFFKSELHIILEVSNYKEKATQYTKEFKEEAVTLITDQGYSFSEAGRNPGKPEKNSIYVLCLKTMPSKLSVCNIVKIGDTRLVS